MEIVPQDQRLVAELMLPIDSVSDLVLGMPAEVRLRISAYDPAGRWPA